METDREDADDVYNPVSEMLGAMLRKYTVVVNDPNGAADEIWFDAEDGRTFHMTHDQDCCETARLVDVSGDLEDLIGSPIVQAEEATNRDNPPEYAESHTWTFYKFATNKGSVTLRWLVDSNGYYSEAITFRTLGAVG